MTAAYMTYWIYQHLGNLSPAELARNDALAQVREAGDGEQLLRGFAREATEEIAGTRWSYRRDFGRTRLLVLDSRAGRVLDDDHREMLSEEEWAWVEESMTGDFDHLLVATTLPWLMSPGLHHLEAWNEAVCAGAWGKLAARAGEKLRQAFDLEHWAAFHDSFVRLAGLFRRSPPAGAGPRRPRSSCSRATCTTRIWRRRRSRARPPSTAGSCRPCARRSATRWTAGSGGRWSSRSRGPPRPSRGGWRARPACGPPT